ncbi:MAG: glycine zipper 2TM domain-containing protein [Steroidobacteraceae bacterium]
MSKYRHPIPASALVIAAAGLVTLAACGGPAPAPAPDAAAPPAASGPTEAERNAELAAREQELATRENELAKKELEQKEQDLARQQAELAAQQEAVAKQAAAAKAAAAKAAAAQKPAAKPAATAAHATAKPLPTRLVVPAGTNLTMALSSGITTKTAKSGDTFGAIVVSDVMVGNKVAIPAGSHVTGRVTNVVSGSNKIGGVPTLALRFDSLELPDGQRVGLNGDLVQQGRSDTGRDTAKILGGAAAGAVIGHQVDNSDKGKVIGGLLGGAAGALAAKKTGAEVELPQDSTLTIATGAPIEVTAR